RPAAAERDERLARVEPGVQLRLPAPVLPGRVDRPDQSPAVVSRSSVTDIADALRERPGTRRRLRRLARLRARGAVEPRDQRRGAGPDVRGVHGPGHDVVRPAGDESVEGRGRDWEKGVWVGLCGRGLRHRTWL